jgi:AhpD family alkylhydroperoxidase
MASRVNYQEVAADGMRAMYELERFAASSVDRRLYELVKIRASLINGCAFCLDMHGFDALKEGETQQRLFVLSAWREAGDLFDARERAALALTEAITNISVEGVPDDVWDEAAARFDEKELAGLVFAITTINAWNRLAVSSHAPLPRR